MPAPYRYERGYSFSGFQANSPQTPLPGPKIDIELENIERSIGGTITNLGLIQRADGALRNGIVTNDALSPGLQTGVNPAEMWVAAKSYAPGDTIFADVAFYRCIVGHVSGVFADDLSAGYWLKIADFEPIVADAIAAREDAEAAATAAAGSAGAAAGSAGASAASAESSAASALEAANLIGGTVTQAVRWDTPQTLTSPQQAQARSNVGVVFASQAEAEAASSLTTFMSPGRAAQLIDARSINPSRALPATIVVDLYGLGDAAGRASHALTSAHTANLAGKERYTMFIGNYDSGTGDGTVPASTYGLGVSSLKDNWTLTTRKGQNHGISIVTRGGFHGTDDEPGSGNPGDTAAMVTNTIVSSAQSFACAIEGVSGWADFGSMIPGSTKLIRYQVGGVSHNDDIGHGYYAAAVAGALTHAFFATNALGGAAGDGLWDSAFLYQPDLGDGYFDAFQINQSGWAVFGNGPGATLPNQFKTIRIGGGGSLEFLSSNQLTVIASLTEAGNFRVAQSIKLAPTTAPAAEQGLMYQRNSDGKLMFCEDGVNFRVVTTT